MSTLSIIVALDRNRIIGRDGDLPWSLPADLQRFKDITTGHPVIMGRKTHASIGRPLPNRRNIVLTRDPDYAAAGCEVVHGLDEALDLCRDEPEVFIIGGRFLYREALPKAQRLYITEVDAEVEGDTWFPDWNPDQWTERSRETHPADDRHPHPYAFTVWERKA